MKKERMTIDVDRLHVNKGQIDWLPRNPREWRDDDMMNMRRSIREDPDFLEDRPALVLPLGDDFVIFCGNFRTEGARAEGIRGIPSVVYHPKTQDDRLTVIRRAMKDNGSYGRFDYDVLADEWDEFPLDDWGVKTFGAEEKGPKPEDFGTSFSLPEGDKSEFGVMNFNVSDAQRKIIQDALDVSYYCDIRSEELTANKNGNGLAFIASEWLNGQRLDASVDELRAKVDELRFYLRDALSTSGHKASDVDALLGTSGMSGHYFGESQWMFPTREAYEKMKTIMDLTRDWKECKIIEYEWRRTVKLLEINGTR